MDYVDSFISMFLDVIEYIVELELKREFRIENPTGTDKSFTNCRQINEIETLLPDFVSKITNEKIYIFL